MNYKKQIFSILVIFVLLFLLGIVFGFSGKIGLCVADNVRLIYDTDCLSMYNAMATPLFLGSITIIIIAVILLFTRESTYFAWRRFAKWAIPISAFILIIVPSDTPGSWMGGGDLTKETASWGIAILFLVISIGIIIKKSFNNSL